jgi:hypothetical protein
MHKTSKASKCRKGNSTMIKISSSWTEAMKNKIFDEAVKSSEFDILSVVKTVHHHPPFPHVIVMKTNVSPPEGGESMR